MKNLNLALLFVSLLVACALSGCSKSQGAPTPAPADRRTAIPDPKPAPVDFCKRFPRTVDTVPTKFMADEGMMQASFINDGKGIVIKGVTGQSPTDRAFEFKYDCAGHLLNISPDSQDGKFATIMMAALSNWMEFAKK